VPAPHVFLPTADHVLSPHTGWTRAHWETLAERQLEALVPYATPGCAQYRVLAPSGVTVREGGYAVAARTRPTAERGHGWAPACTGNGLTSVVVALHGWDEDTDIAREFEANAFGPHSATPYLRCAAGHPGDNGMYVTLLALTRDRVHPQALRESVSCAVEGDEVRITFPEGHTVAV